MIPNHRSRPASQSRIRVAALILSLATLLIAASSTAQVPDYSGTWSLSTVAELPDDGGTCVFEGTAQVTQDGTELSGTATLMLVDGPAACPPMMMADLSGAVGEGDCVTLGLLLGGQLGEATFSGCPGNLPDTLDGQFQVTSGPFAGTGGSWSAVLGPSVLAIPTLSALGLAALVVVLMLTGAWLMRRRTIV